MTEASSGVPLPTWTSFKAPPTPQPAKLEFNLHHELVQAGERRYRREFRGSSERVGNETGEKINESAVENAIELYNRSRRS